LEERFFLLNGLIVEGSSVVVSEKNKETGGIMEKPLTNEEQDVVVRAKVEEQAKRVVQDAAELVAWVDAVRNAALVAQEAAKRAKAVGEAAVKRLDDMTFGGVHDAVVRAEARLTYAKARAAYAVARAKKEETRAVWVEVSWIADAVRDAEAWVDAARNAALVAREAAVEHEADEVRPEARTRAVWEEAYKAWEKRVERAAWVKAARNAVQKAQEAAERAIAVEQSAEWVKAMGQVADVVRKKAEEARAVWAEAYKAWVAEAVVRKNK
jgi:hypothetical protein